MVRWLEEVEEVEEVVAEVVEVNNLLYMPVVIAEAIQQLTYMQEMEFSYL
jgi:hypothetical protein